MLFVAGSDKSKKGIWARDATEYVHGVSGRCQGQHQNGIRLNGLKRYVTDGGGQATSRRKRRESRRTRDEGACK